jgi:hypothetical protein
VVSPPAPPEPETAEALPVPWLGGAPPSPATASGPKGPGMGSLLGGALAFLLLAGLAAWFLLPRLRQAPASPVAALSAPPAPPAPAATPTITATASAQESIVATAKPPASVAPSPSPGAKPFDARAARATLDALSPTLIDCKIPIGRAGRIRVGFAPDGTVSSAEALPPFAGTAGGACVEGHIREAKIAPFAGSAPTYNYGFVIPRY